MPSQRRLKALGLLLLLSVLTIYYLRSGASQTRTSDFYTKTVEALNARARTVADKADGARQRMQGAAEEKGQQVKKAAGGYAGAGVQKVQEVLGEARDAAVGKMQDVKDRAVEGVGKQVTATRDKDDEESASKSVAGRKMMKDDDGVAKVGGTVEGPSGKEEAQAKEELNAILKRSPIIIFSKSYCPHSMKAKRILLEHYSIDPAPYVVELDRHPLGAHLQDALQKSTGRRTVPNVLVNGKSIGGGDDVQGLDERGEVVSTVRRLGGKKILGVSKVVG